MTVRQRRAPMVHEAWLPREHSLHRPRHGGRQLVALLSAVVFFAAPTLFWALGARPAEIENRPLAKAPSLADGWGFFTGLSQWATDHLVFRGAAVQAADGVSRGVFGEPAPFDRGGTQDKLPEGPIAPTEDPRSAAGYPKVIRGKDGWLYYGYDVEGKCVPVRPLDETFRSLERLRQVVEASGRRFVLIVPPDKTTMVPEHLPDSYAGKDCAARASDEFWRRLAAEPGVVDMRDLLRQAAAQVHHPTYFPLDTHWTSEAGLVMTSELAEVVQPGVTKTWVVAPGQDWSSPSDLPKLIGGSGENKIRYYSLKPDGGQDVTRVTPMDLAHPLRFTSPAGTGKVTERVGLLTDSFSILASPFLAGAFTDVTLLNYGTLTKDASVAADMLSGQQVVVVEVVERNLASGSADVLDPAVIEQLGRVLAEHPLR